MNWIKELTCILFHPIKTINHCHFVDMVSGEEVGKHKCLKCNKIFISVNKKDLFRVYIED